MLSIRASVLLAAKDLARLRREEARLAQQQAKLEEEEAIKLANKASDFEALLGRLPTHCNSCHRVKSHKWLLANGLPDPYWDPAARKHSCPAPNSKGFTAHKLCDCPALTAKKRQKFHAAEHVAARRAQVAARIRQHTAKVSFHLCVG